MTENLKCPFCDEAVVEHEDEYDYFTCNTGSCAFYHDILDEEKITTYSTAIENLKQKARSEILGKLFAEWNCQEETVSESTHNKYGYVIIECTDMFPEPLFDHNACKRCRLKKKYLSEPSASIEKNGGKE